MNMLESVEFFAKSSALALAAAFFMQPGYEPVAKKESITVVDSTPAVEAYNTVMADWCKQQLSCSKIAEAVYFEARGDGELGMQAVANVIMNRAKSSGDSPYDVIVKPKQFSYLSRSDLTIYDLDSYKSALRIAALATSGMLPDITDGSNHYVAPKRLASMPKWANDMEHTVVVLDHHFFRG